MNTQPYFDEEPDTTDPNGFEVIYETVTERRAEMNWIFTPVRNWHTTELKFGQWLSAIACILALIAFWSYDFEESQIVAYAWDWAFGTLSAVCGLLWAYFTAVLWSKE